MDSKKIKGLGTVNELSEARLWKTLDGISNRLSGIESQLSEVVRLEERVNNHEKALSRYGNRLDEHSARIRESELWQANYGDRSSLERLLEHVQVDVSGLRSKVTEIESDISTNKGQKDVGKEILKWISAVLAAIVIYKINKGS
jgi:chromosome segregation ATPase